MPLVKLMNAKVLKLADQVNELRAFTGWVGNRDEHDEQFVQARGQQFMQAGRDCVGITEDDQVVDEVVRHAAIGGNGKACVGEHAGVEGQTAITSDLLAGGGQDSLSILAERYRDVGDEWRCRASMLLRARL